MIIRMILGGLVTAAVFGCANAAAEIATGWSLTAFTLADTIPAGAGLLGLFGAWGAGLVINLHADRRGEAFSLFIAGALIGAAAVLAHYFALYQNAIYPTLLHSAQLSFPDFVRQYLSHSSFTGGQSFLAGAAGGVFGASAAAAWRRQSAGLKAIPRWIKDSAALMAHVAHADGVLRAEETDAIIAMLRAQGAQYYNVRGAHAGDLDAFARDLALSTLDATRTLPLAQNLKKLRRASEANRRLALLGAALVALSDGDLASQELALIHAIAKGLGFRPADVDTALDVARIDLAHPMRRRRAG